MGGIDGLEVWSGRLSVVVSWVEVDEIDSRIYMCIGVNRVLVIQHLTPLILN